MVEQSPAPYGPLVAAVTKKRRGQGSRRRQQKTARPPSRHLQNKGNVASPVTLAVARLGRRGLARRRPPLANTARQKVAPSLRPPLLT